VRSYQEKGALVVHGSGRLAGPGQVEADGRRLLAEHVIVATGSDPVRPPIQGLDRVEVWTNREATQLRQVPGRAIVIGGGPVGIELGQLLGRLGCQVTLVEAADRLIAREDPRVGELIQQALAGEGADVRVRAKVVRATRGDGGTVVELDDGTKVETDVVIVGTGRTPRLGGLGLDSVGVQVGERGLGVDDRCRVVGAQGLWAVGDVTGVAPFTHVAKYQARVVADNILGRPRRASCRGVPRVVFADPEIAAVGLTEAEARQRGHEVATATLVLGDSLSRPWTYERDPRGEFGLVADRSRRVLLGAWAVAPLASEWIHQAALAVRAEVPIDVLLDGVAQFPTYSEALVTGLERLSL
jgi:pyruvate/2-oxoglutarate dehydrogenase complex dihydrolipoamide dehydrogenase (E3) component